MLSRRVVLVSSVVVGLAGCAERPGTKKDDKAAQAKKAAKRAAKRAAERAEKKKAAENKP